MKPLAIAVLAFAGFTIYWVVTAKGSGSSDPFSSSTNPLAPVDVGVGGDEAYGPAGSNVSAAGTAQNGVFTLSGVINWFDRTGKMQETTVPGLAGTKFAYSTSDPAAAITIPQSILGKLMVALSAGPSSGGAH